jgi:NADH dehydrogenase
MQQGRYGACVIARRLEGRVCEPFRYRDRGSMATIGRSAAVADFGSIRFGGFPACLLWSAVHVFSLIECENRVLVALRWLWNYVTRHRGTWLITGSPHAA